MARADRPSGQETDDGRDRAPHARTRKRARRVAGLRPDQARADRLAGGKSDRARRRAAGPGDHRADYRRSGQGRAAALDHHRSRRAVRPDNAAGDRRAGRVCQIPRPARRSRVVFRRRKRRRGRGVGVRPRPGDHPDRARRRLHRRRTGKRPRHRRSGGNFARPARFCAPRPPRSPPLLLGWRWPGTGAKRSA